MSPSSPTVPSTGLVGSNSPGAMGRAPGLRRRVKNSVKVGYSSMGRSASLASTPYFLAKARITARITGRGAETRQAAPTARESVFLGNRRSNVYDNSAMGHGCLAGPTAERYCCWPSGGGDGGEPGRGAPGIYIWYCGSPASAAAAGRGRAAAAAGPASGEAAGGAAGGGGRGSATRREIFPPVTSTACPTMPGSLPLHTSDGATR